MEKRPTYAGGIRSATLPSRLIDQLLKHIALSVERWNMGRPITDILALTLSALIAEVIEERSADPEVCPVPSPQAPPPLCGGI